jgi:hypothetical protein
MTKDYHVCPRCQGVGIIEVVWQGVPPEHADAADCPMCDAYGYVPRAQAERYDAGCKLRQARVAAGKSLREAAEERGISMKEMSDIEWGRT